MQVELYFKDPSYMENWAQWAYEESKTGYYTYPRGKRNVKPLEPEWLPEIVVSNLVWPDQTIFCGAKILPDMSMFYMGCAGNWTWLSPDQQTVRQGGRRHGLKSFGHDLPSDQVSYMYPVNGTQRPDLAPWETATGDPNA